MESLFIDATKATPQIMFDFDKKDLFIKGQSYPENAVNFYKPVKVWLENFLESEEGEIVLKIKLDYLNTSSTKCIMDILEMFNDAYNEGKNTKIMWYYHPENESLKECGEEFKEDLELPFEISEMTD